MPTQYGFPLFDLQLSIYHRLIKRLTEGQPTLLWVGRQSGASTICAEVSRAAALEGLPQLFVGNNMEGMEGFACSPEDYVHPAELPVVIDPESSSIWDTEDGWSVWDNITPYTIVFVDGLFSMANPFQLYNKIVARTAHVIAWGQIDSYADDWYVGQYMSDLIGPYASWEMNPLLSEETLRKERGNRPADIRRFNIDTVAVSNMENLKYWSNSDG